MCVWCCSDDKHLVIGTFQQYNGSSVNNIVKLNTGGTIDLSFNSGSGFLGSTLSVIETNDGGYVKDETFLVKVLDSYIKQKTYCEKLINDLNNY